MSLPLAPLVLSAKIETKCTPEMTRADLDAALESATVAIIQAVFAGVPVLGRTPAKPTASGCGPGWFCMQSELHLVNGSQLMLHIHQQRLVRE